MTNFYTLNHVYKSSKTRRYHNRPTLDQNVQEHSFGVVLIISILHPNPSVNLLKVSAWHDASEGKYGDFLAPAKDRFIELAELDKKLNLMFWEELNIDYPKLTEEEQLWLDFADRYECALFARSCYPVQQEILDDALAKSRKIAEKLKGKYGYFEDVNLLLL